MKNWKNIFNGKMKLKKKKNEFKKQEFFLKIDKIIEKLKVKNENYKVYEKIKKQVINDEIIVDKAYDKLYSLKIINKK